MIPVLIEIGPIEIGSYGIILALAFLICGWLLRNEFRRNKIIDKWAFGILISAVFGGVIGARIYFILEHLSEFTQEPLNLILSRGGLTWYGGFLGGFITVIWKIRKLPVSTLKIADIISPLLLLGYGIGRIGCFFAGDGDYGPPSALPWAMAFPNGLVPTTVPVHPTPLYEMLISWLFFALLWFNRKKVKTPGIMITGMFIFYGIERFLTEFWRLTPKIIFGYLSLAQLLSIFLILFGIFWGRYRLTTA